MGEQVPYHPKLCEETQTNICFKNIHLVKLALVTTPLKRSNNNKETRIGTIDIPA